MFQPSMPSPNECDRARAKDPRFDCLFFTAVRRTRIYCRPVCPAQRHVREYGELRIDGPIGPDRCFPKPKSLVDTPLEKIGLPKARVATLRSLASAVLNGSVGFQVGQLLDDFVANFNALPGIGAWTAHYVALRALSHPNAFPAGDLVLQQVLGLGKRLGIRETEARSQSWRPWRAYAVLHLWHLSGETTQGVSHVV